jgi:peptidoglycan hydrolase-like protein with peptidoglycan-binding domain
MKLTHRFLPFFIIILTAVSAVCQEEVPDYTVQIGNFVNPKPSDFAQLQSLGFVYAARRPSNYTDIYIGGYNTEKEAEAIAEKLRSQGYDNAFVSRLNVEGGQSSTVIQLATKRAGDKINWDELSQAGPLFVALNGSEVKIVTGSFPDVAGAKAQLPRLQKLGFKDAFPRNINNVLLHEVTEFEMGGPAKKPLIPLDLAEKTGEQPLADAKGKTEVPSSYEDISVTAPSQKASEMTSKGLPDAEKKADKAKEAAPAPAEASIEATLPDIRPGVKRTSALELQKVLKSAGSYKGSLDGYYGKGTRTAYDQALSTNRQLNKYRILARYLDSPADDAPKGSVQYYINTLWNDPKTALDGLELSKFPIAKAYRAYFLFVNDGAGKDVNGLMNDAIKEAFAGKKGVEFPKFDPSATYAYYDLDQLLLHVRYIHEVSPDQPAAPCWLFRKHPGGALKAFGPQSFQSNLKLQTCGGFWEWEEVKLLNTIAQDLCGLDEVSEAQCAKSQSDLAQLYLTPKALSEEDRKALETWNTNLWKGLDGWASRDPMLAEIATGLKIVYFQNWVLFEDYFMNEGFNEKEAKALGLSAIRSLVGHHLERFI